MHDMMMVAGLHSQPGRVQSKRTGETPGFEETFQTALPRVGNYYEHRDDEKSETLPVVDVSACLPMLQSFFVISFHFIFCLSCTIWHNLYLASGEKGKHSMDRPKSNWRDPQLARGGCQVTKKESKSKLSNAELWEPAM